MTKIVDWDKFQSMTPRQKSEINTSTMFSEQREQDEDDDSEKNVGLKKMEEEVPIEWPDETEKSKASSIYTTPGALVSRTSGGKEGVNLMHEIDKFKRKEPSELDPKKPTEETDANKVQ